MSTRLASWMFYAGLLITPIYRGGNADAPPMILLVFCALSLILSSLGSTNTKRPALPTMGIILWAAWLGWLVFQLIPLPPDLLARLSPQAFAYHQAVAQAGGQAHYSLSLVPARGLELVVLSVTYAIVYLTTLSIAHDQTSVRRVLSVITLTAALEAVYGALHLLAGIGHPLLDPANAHQGVATGTFANRNHFAAFLCLGFCAGLGLILGRKNDPNSAGSMRARLRALLDLLTSEVVLFRVLLLVIVVGVVLSQSRMGNAALALAVTVYALAWLLSTRRAASFGKGLLLFVSIAVADVLLVSERYGLERVMERIEQTDYESEVRFVANDMSHQLINRFGHIGAGLGSYPILQESVRPEGFERSFRHAHNDYYEFWIEVGIPGLVLLGVLLLYHALRAAAALRERRSWRRASGAAVLAVIAAGLLHATVEFNFRIPAYVAYFVTLLALATRLQGRGSTRSIGRWLKPNHKRGMKQDLDIQRQ